MNPVSLALDRETGQMAARDLKDAILYGIEGQQTTIWVDGNRSDSYTEIGSFANPFKTIFAAMAAARSDPLKTKMMILPSRYEIDANLVLPNNSFSIIGVGDPIDARDTWIEGVAGATALFDIQPDTLISTAVYNFENLYLDNGETDQVGIQVDNTNAAKKIVLRLRNVAIEAGGNGIDVDHDLGSEGVCIYADDCFFEGNIVFDCGNDDDRLYFRDCFFDEAIVDTTGDNTTLKLRAIGCVVPHAAWATNGGQTSQLCMCMGCYAMTDKTTYAALDTNEIGASAKFTETIIA